MKSIMSLTVALVLGCTAVACGGDVCEQAWEKHQDCAASMDCKLMDLMLRQECENAKKYYAIDYSIFKANQEANGDDLTCEGQVKQDAEAIMACTLAEQSLCRMCQ